jgi:glycolate oxidase FAD binding subunit
VTLTMLEPVDAEMAASMLGRARAERLTVGPRGCGSKSAWWPRPASDVTMSMRSLAGPLHHYSGDLVATLPAGMTLAAANQHLALANQSLPLDPDHFATATIGGIVATNDSGPRRHRYGAPRDLIIGIEVALTDGRVVRAGGRVVKNVAGYDLSRLLCGSAGALGIITSATFKLAPLPATSRTVIVRVGSPSRAADLARIIDALPVTPTALEISGGREALLLVRFETTAQAAERMAESITGVCADAAATPTIVAGETEAQVWQQHRDAVWQPSHTVAKVSLLPTEVGPLLAALDRHSAAQWAVAGRAALGVLIIALEGEPAALVSALQTLDQQATAAKGFVSLLQASPDVRERFAPTRRPSPLDTVKKVVKARFDPDGTLPDLV